MSHGFDWQQDCLLKTDWNRIKTFIKCGKQALSRFTQRLDGKIILLETVSSRVALRRDLSTSPGSRAKAKYRGIIGEQAGLSQVEVEDQAWIYVGAHS